MKSLQCSFSENVLYYRGILQIGRFIFQDFYRIPVDNELVAWSCPNTKSKVSAFQQSRPRRVANCHVCDTCQGEKMKIPHTCGTIYVYYPRSVLALGYRRCLRLYVRPCVNHKLVIMITRHPFQAKITKFGPEVQNNLVVHILSKSPHSNYMYVQFLPFNSLRLRDGWLFTDDIFQCIFSWFFF